MVFDKKMLEMDSNDVYVIKGILIQGQNIGVLDVENKPVTFIINFLLFYYNIVRVKIKTVILNLFSANL